MPLCLWNNLVRKVLAVVIVNTLLTGVIAKLAKFERHVSLSDYTSTVTVKLALAQFLNTALIVIIVNAGYSGGGLDVLKVYTVKNSHQGRIHIVHHIQVGL